MSRSFRFVALVAVVFAGLALSTAGATALRMRISPTRNIVIPSLGNISFITSERTIRCPVTINANLVESIERVSERTRIGTVSSINVNEGAACETVVVETGLNSANQILIRALLTFRGEGIEDVFGFLVVIEEFKVKLTIGGIIECLYSGDVTALLEVSRIGRGEYNSRLLTLLGTDTLELSSGLLCPPNKRVSGSFRWPATTIRKFA